MSGQINIFAIISWIFGIFIMAIGVVNIFWGNDQLFGIFIFLGAFIYFPPIALRIERLLGFSIPVVVKVIAGVLVLFGAIGVGELPGKIELMLNSVS